MKFNRNICRKNLSSATFITIFSFRHAIMPFLGALTLSGILPATLYCCSGSPEEIQPSPALCMTKVSLQQDVSVIRSLDIFVFNDDELQRLDCYQRFEEMDDWTGTVVSGSGKRILTAVANCIYEREDWLPLRSRSHLKSFNLRLEDEVRQSPVMTGEIHMTTGRNNPGKTSLKLKPLASEIVLNSISCDFSGRPYEGARVTDAVAYLTNVNAEYSLLEDKNSGPRRIINAGGLCEDDIEEFMDSGLIVQDIAGEISRRTIYPDIRLRCYRSDKPEEGPGTPYTRLVIEGTLAGTRYYWPIDINREDGGEGIEEGKRYTYDIKITRKGSLDPDIPIKTADFSVIQTISEWKEQERYEVKF